MVLVKTDPPLPKLKTSVAIVRTTWTSNQPTWTHVDARSSIHPRPFVMPDAAESAVPKLTTTLEVSVADLGAIQLDPPKPAVKQSSSSALLPLTTKEYVRLHLPMIIKTIAVVLVAALISTLIGVQSINVRACNSTAADGEEEEEEEASGVSSFVGIGIACVANAFNGGGMSLQKVGHNRVAAAAGGTTDVNSVGHFKQPMVRVRVRVRVTARVTARVRARARARVRG